MLDRKVKRKMLETTAPAAEAPRKQRPPVFISSPLAALVEGIYRADTTIGRIRQKGNFGIGTFNDLDGEMVFLDDQVYCLRPQGDAEVISDEVRTPFALVTQFEGDTQDLFALHLHKELPDPRRHVSLFAQGKRQQKRQRSLLLLYQ